MNAERVPFEALKERSRVCFGGFRLPARSLASGSLAEGRRFGKAGPLKHVKGPRLRAATHFGVQARALARGASLLLIVQGVRREGTLQRIATKSIPQSFQGQNVFRGNIPQIDVGTKPKDKELLLILDRSFPL